MTSPTTTSNTTTNSVSSNLTHNLMCQLYPIEANNDTLFTPFLIVFNILYDDVDLSKHKAILNNVLNLDGTPIDASFASVAPTHMSKFNLSSDNTYLHLGQKDTRKLLSVLIVTHQSDKINNYFFNQTNPVFDSFNLTETQEEMFLKKPTRNATRPLPIGAASTTVEVLTVGKQPGNSVRGISQRNENAQRQQDSQSQIHLYVMFGVIGVLAIVLFYFMMKKNN